jgi:hypothetical protein
MTISKLDDLGGRFITTPWQPGERTVKTEVWDPVREEQYQGEIDRTRQEQADTQEPVASTDEKPPVP